MLILNLHLDLTSPWINSFFFNMMMSWRFPWILTPPYFLRHVSNRLKSHMIILWITHWITPWSSLDLHNFFLILTLLQRWSLGSPQKKTLRNRCWTRDRLSRRRLSGPTRCLLCDQRTIILDHLMVQCPTSRFIWFHFLRRHWDAKVSAAGW
jgi:hypothetical protein